MIDNFSLLSAAEQEQFALELLQKINESKIFSDSISFDKIDSYYGIKADELDGSLNIYIDFDKIIFDREYVDDGEDTEYTQSPEKDVAALFKTLETTLAGYDIKLVIDDVPNVETIEREVLDRETKSEDVGIGSYEFWGDRGYDSRIVEWDVESGIETCESDALVHFEVVKH